MIFKEKLARRINFLLFAGLPFILSGCLGGGGGSSSATGSSDSIAAAGTDPSSSLGSTGDPVTTGGSMASVHGPEPTSLLLMAVGVLILMAYFRAKASKPCLK